MSTALRTAGPAMMRIHYEWNCIVTTVLDLLSESPKKKEIYTFSSPRCQVSVSTRTHSHTNRVTHTHTHPFAYRATRTHTQHTHPHSHLRKHRDKHTQTHSPVAAALLPSRPQSWVYARSRSRVSRETYCIHRYDLPIHGPLLHLIWQTG